jgi:hypothetical protein
MKPCARALSRTPAMRDSHQPPVTILIFYPEYHHEGLISDHVTYNAPDIQSIHSSAIRGATTQTNQRAAVLRSSETIEGVKLTLLEVTFSLFSSTRAEVIRARGRMKESAPYR